MRDACPACHSQVDVDDGQLTACPGCGHWWIVGQGHVAPTGDEEDGPDPWLAESSSASGIPQLAQAPLPPPRAVRRGPAQADPGAQPWEFELQFAEGDAWQGPYDRFSLREMIYVGRLTGDEQLRSPGGADCERLGDLPEFGDVLQLLGKTEVTGTHRHSIAGWQRGASPSAPTPDASTPAAAGPAAPMAALPSAQSPTPVPALSPSPVPAPVPAKERAAAPSASKLPMIIGLVFLLVMGLGVVIGLALS